MGARTKARRRALDILFEADVRDADPIDILAQHEARRVAAGHPPLLAYTDEVVRSVTERRDMIDARINAAAIGWELDRMPRVDRNALRIAVWEIDCNPDVPDAVAVSEALAAVRELSGDESPAFVNGVLGQVIASVT